MERIFTVAAEFMPEFSDLLVENELANEISGTTEDSAVVIVVNYRIDQKGAVLDLVDWLEEKNSEGDDDEDDDEDDDDDSDED